MRIAAVLRPEHANSRPPLFINDDGELTADRFALGALSEVDAQWLVLLVVSWTGLGSEETFQRVAAALGGLPIGDPQPFLNAMVLSELTHRRFFLRLRRGIGRANQDMAIEKELEAREYVTSLVESKIDASARCQLKELNSLASLICANVWRVFSEYLADDPLS